MEYAMPTPDKISPCLWFESAALEAAQYYTSIFKDGAITNVMKSAADTPGPKEGQVVLVDFTLFGRSYQALNGGPYAQFNDGFFQATIRPLEGIVVPIPVIGMLKEEGATEVICHAYKHGAAVGPSNH